MKTLLTLAWVLVLPGGDREQGLQLFAAGKYGEAAAAFRAAIASEGDSAELQWNLALASLRAGDLAAAEVAAEKYAALDRAARTDLHAGLLGAVRHAEAQALANEALPLLGGAVPPAATAAPGQPAAAPPDPLPLLEQALAKCKQGRDHFVRGAAARPSPELLRNTERSLRLLAGLEKQIEELKKQREQQKKNEPDQNQDPQKEQPKDDKQDDKKPEEQPKPEQPPKPDEAKDPGQEPEPKEPQPDDKPAEQPKDKPDDKAQQQQPPQGKPEQPKDAQGQGQDGDRKDAPGEGQEGREQSAEQAQRVQDNLQKQDQKRRELLLRQKAQRPRVERDW